MLNEPPHATVPGVRLLDVEPELAVGLPADELAEARALAVPCLDLAAGESPPAAAFSAALGAILVDGLMVRTSNAFGRPDAALAGPGDLVDGRALAAGQGRWRTLAPTRLALLDARFVRAARRWPALMAGLADRLFAAQEDHRTVAAIRGMSRVEDRLLALLGHAAVRWGRVTPDGVALDLPVTHELLGLLVGARRPTVSLALSTLREQGLLVRRAAGSWVLPAGCDRWATDGLPAAKGDVGARAA
jgi:CRP/FNR family transcriptional regulator, cyclic AMP receptor protein